MQARVGTCLRPLEMGTYVQGATHGLAGVRWMKLQNSRYYKGVGAAKGCATASGPQGRRSHVAVAGSCVVAPASFVQNWPHCNSEPRNMVEYRREQRL